MVNREKASRIAEAAMPGALDLQRIHELQQGWFFPIRPPEEPQFGGDCGLIVNKQTGEVYKLAGSVFGVERDLEMYDKGYQFGVYDLVVLEVQTLNETLDVLVDLRISVTTPEYANGTVWRVPRRLTRAELRRALSRLPCVFESAHLYSHLERLEEARQKGYFRFEALKHSKST